MTETSPSTTAMGTQLRWDACAIGSATLTTGIMIVDNESGFQLFSNQVIDQNRIFRPRQYTVGTLPTPTATGMVSVSDEGGRSATLYSDNVNWRRTRDLQVASATVDYTGIWGNLAARTKVSQLSALSQAMQRLNDYSLLAKLKSLVMHAMPAATDGLLDWINPATKWTITGTNPTTTGFTTNLGFLGNGTDIQINSGKSTTNWGVTQDDFAIGTFIITGSTAAASVIGKVSGTRDLNMRSALSGNLINTRMQDTTDETITAPARFTGLFTMTRDPAATGGYKVYLDDVVVFTSVVASTALTGGSLAFLSSTASGITSFSTARVACSYVSLGLTAADVSNLSAIISEYLEVIGAIDWSVTHLPPAANFKKRSIYVPDLGGGSGVLDSDGVNWYRQGLGGYEARSLATGSETLTYLTNATNVEYTATLTGNVTVTLAGVDAKGTTVKKGARFLITHNNATPGAFTFAIANGGGGGGTLITFGSATNKAATLVFDGTNWRLMMDAAL